MVRYVGGPLPSTFCVLQLHVRKAFFIQLMLIMDAIVISRAVFIFYLKNPAAFNDDFWSRFLNCFIFGFSVLHEVASFQMPGRITAYYYICTGKSPLQDMDIPIKNTAFRDTLIMFTILSHVIVIVRIHIYKRKQLLGEAGGQALVQCKKFSLALLSANAFLAFLMMLVLILVEKINLISLKDLNYYPNYSFEYLLRMACPIVFSVAMVLLYMYQCPKFKLYLKQKLASNLNFCNK
jgi:hypothetical protein